MGAGHSYPLQSATAVTSLISRMLTGGLANSDEPSSLIFKELLPVGFVVDTGDLFRFFSSAHVLDLAHHQPRTLARLIIYACHILEVASNDPSPKDDVAASVMNASRLLSRIIPPLLGDLNSTSFVDALFWENLIPLPQAKNDVTTTAVAATAAAAAVQWGPIQAAATAKATTTSSTTTTTVKSEVVASGDHDETAVNDASGGDEADGTPQLGVRLIHAIFRLAFSPVLSISVEAHAAFIKRITSMNTTTTTVELNTTTNTTTMTGSSGDGGDATATTTSTPSSNQVPLSLSQPPPSSSSTVSIKKIDITKDGSIGVELNPSCIIASVNTSGLASIAGALVGDKITAVGSKEIVSRDELVFLLKTTIRPMSLTLERTISSASSSSSPVSASPSPLVSAVSAAEVVDSPSSVAVQQPSSLTPPSMITTPKPTLSLTTTTTTTLVPSVSNPITTPNIFNAVWPTLLWTRGAGCDASAPPPNADQLIVRNDILRLLISLLSAPLYSPPIQGSTRSRFTDVATNSSTPFAPTLFFSLLNTALNFDPHSGVFGAPYAGVAGIGSTENEVAGLSLQTLLALVDYAPLVVGTTTPPSPNGETVSYTQYNSFRRLFALLREGGDVDFIFEGLATLLSANPRAASTTLPGSLTPLTWSDEVVVLFWKLLDESPAFAFRMLSSRGDAARLAGPLLWILAEARTKPSHSRSASLAAMMLGRLSSERRFSVAMNARIPIGTLHTSFSPPRNIAIGGIGSVSASASATCGDALSLVTSRFCIDDTNSRLSQLAPLLACTLTNCAPFTKGLSFDSSTRLLNTIDLLTQPSALFGHGGAKNALLAGELIKGLSEILLHQADSNSILIYSIILRASQWGRIAALDYNVWKKHSRPLTSQSPLPPTTDTTTTTTPTTTTVWSPSEEWWNSIKPSLDVKIFQQLVTYLMPRIATSGSNASSSPLMDEERVTAFLARETLVGILPLPGPVM